MDVDWTNLLLQLPVVAAVIWFAMEMQKRAQESMDKRDARYLEVLDKISNKLDQHDAKVTERIGKAVDEVKTNNRKRAAP